MNNEQTTFPAERVGRKARNTRCARGKRANNDSCLSGIFGDSRVMHVPRCGSPVMLPVMRPFRPGCPPIRADHSSDSQPCLSPPRPSRLSYVDLLQTTTTTCNDNRQRTGITAATRAPCSRHSRPVHLYLPNTVVAPSKPKRLLRVLGALRFFRPIHSDRHPVTKP